MKTARGSLSLTYAEDTNTPNNLYINGSTNFQESYQVELKNIEVVTHTKTKHREKGTTGILVRYKSLREIWIDPKN